MFENHVSFIPLKYTTVSFTDEICIKRTLKVRLWLGWRRRTVYESDRRRGRNGWRRRISGRVAHVDELARDLLLVGQCHRGWILRFRSRRSCASDPVRRRIVMMPMTGRVIRMILTVELHVRADQTSAIDTFTVGTVQWRCTRPTAAHYWRLVNWTMLIVGL